MNLINSLISGLSLGSVYAIIALGYTMVYGISKMLNFAHGDVIMVGGYISFILTMYAGLNGWLALVIAMVVCTVLGILIERLAYRPLRAAPSHGYGSLSASARPRVAPAPDLTTRPSPARFPPGSAARCRAQD